MPKTKVNWNSKDVLEILKNQSLTIQQMADKIGVSYWTLSHKRGELGFKYPYRVGIDHKLTNKERKARYNAKIKQIGYKPLYTKKGEKYMKFTIDITTESKDTAIKDKCLSAVNEVLKKDGEYFGAGYATEKYITTEEAIKHCKEEGYVIPSAFLSVFPNNLGINLCAVKGFEVEITDDEQYKSIRVDFIPEEHDKLNPEYHRELHF